MSNSDQPPIVPELLTLQQAAELCGVGKRTLQDWVTKGIAPPPVKFGPSKQSALRFQRQRIMDWIAGGCKPVRGEGQPLPTKTRKNA